MIVGGRVTASAALNDVFIGGQEGYACYRIPALLSLQTTANTTLLVAYCEGRKFNCDDHGWNDLVQKTSHDQGVTWSPLQVVWSESIPHTNVTVGNPAPVGVAGSPCSLLVAFSRNNLAAGVIRSEDCGATYSEDSTLPVGDSYTWIATGPPGAIQLSTGGHLISSDRIAKKGAPYSSFAFINGGPGTTWRASEGIDNGNECQAAELLWRSNATNSVVHLSMRSSNGASRLAAESLDGGETWSAPWSTIPETQCEGSIVALPASKRLVMSSAFSSTRTNMTLHVSSDDGHTWAPLASGPVYPGSSAYSSLSVQTDGAVGSAAVNLLFERDDYAKISFTTVPV